MKMSRRLVLWLVPVAMCLMMVPVAGDMGNEWFKRQSAMESARRGLPASVNNSIKHALAASLSYRWLRSGGLGDESAAAVTLFLGRCNEYVEYLSRSEAARDPTQEVMKDFYNNQAGMEAARWADARGLSLSVDALRERVGALAAGKELVLSRDEMRVSDAARRADLAAAIAWIAQEQQAVAERVGARLDVAYPAAR